MGGRVYRRDQYHPRVPRALKRHWSLASLLGLYLVIAAPLAAFESARSTFPIPPIADSLNETADSPESVDASPRGPAFRDLPGAYPSEVFDQDQYHWLVIDTMADQWPLVDVIDYRSATTPGYHFLQATLLSITGARWPLHAANIAIGMSVILALYTTLLPLAGPMRASLLAAPAALSPFTLSATIWLTTDALALLLIVLAVGLATTRAYTPGRCLRAGAWSAGAVLVRQIHIWPLAPVGLLGLAASPLARRLPAWLRRTDAPEPARRRALLVGVAAAAIPVVALGLFVAFWGGLIPPNDFIRGVHDPINSDRSINLAALPFGLAVAAIFAVPAALALTDHPLRTGLARWRTLALVALLGALPALLVPSTHAPPERGFGWLWVAIDTLDARLFANFPLAGALIDHQRSLTLALLGVAGAKSCALLWIAARSRERTGRASAILLTALGFLCAQAVNPMAWQRYFEPILFAMLAMLAALCIAPEDRAGRPRWPWLLLGLLILFQASFFIVRAAVPFIQRELALH